MKNRFLLPLTMVLLAYTTFAGTVKIQGQIQNAASPNLQCTIVRSALQEKQEGLVIPLDNGKFSHTFDFQETTFLSFGDGANYFGGFVEPGDSVFVTYDQLDFANSVSYSGTGAYKFAIAWSISQIKSVPKRYQAIARAQIFPLDYLFSIIDSLENEISTRIDLSVKDLKGKSGYHLLGFLKATALLTRQNSLVAIFGDSYDNILKDHRKELSQSSIAGMRDFLKFDPTYAGSKMYVEAVELVATTYLEENVQPTTNNFSERRYELLRAMLPEKLRSPVLFRSLVSELTHRAPEINEPAFRQAAARIADARLRQHVFDMLSETKRLKAGDAAPEFTLQNLQGEKVNLDSFRGKTVYMDFWFATCGPCHALFKAIEPVKKQFTHDDRVVFLTISIDNDAVWKKAIARFGVRGYHVFTENQLREHPIIKSYNIASYPTTFIINPAGRLHSVRPSTNPGELSKQIEEALKEVGK